MYNDPEINADLMGWGDPTLHEDHNLAAEAKSQEDIPVICQAGDATELTILPKIEAKLRAKFKFDEGWDFMVAERMVCGFSDTETWMVPQTMGNCVGNSHSGLFVLRYSHEIFALGEAEEPFGKKELASPFIAYTYGVGRMAGNMLGGGDGSYCGAQIKGSMTYGYLPCDTPGLSDAYSNLPQSTTQTERLFGSSKSEILKWTDKAKPFGLLEAPKATSADEAWDLMSNKKVPLQICSNQGFIYKGLDTNGVELYQPGGKPWGHSMQMAAAFGIKSQRYFTIRNQWGQNQHKGSPNQGIAGGCMVITYENFDKWVKRAECIGLGKIQGRPSNPGF